MNNNENVENLNNEVPATEPKVEELITETTSTVAPEPVTEVKVEEPVTEATPVAPAEPVTEAKTTEPETEAKVEEEKTKKKAISPIYIVLLLIAIGGFAVWFFVLGGSKMLSGNYYDTPPEENKKEEKQEEKPVENKDSFKEVELSESEKDIVDNIVNYFITNNTDFKTSIEVSRLTNQEILQAAQYIGQIKEKSVSEEEVDNKVHEIFGNVKYDHESIICKACGKDWYIYSPEDKKYNYNDNHGHGGPSTIVSKMVLETAEKNEAKGLLKVKYKIVYGIISSGISHAPDNYYATVTDLNNQTNGLYPVGTEVIGVKNYDDAYSDYKESIPYTTATFELDNGNMYLKTIELP